MGPAIQPTTATASSNTSPTRLGERWVLLTGVFSKRREQGDESVRAQRINCQRDWSTRTTLAKRFWKDRLARYEELLGLLLLARES